VKKSKAKDSRLYTPAELREIANAATVDPKTVKSFIDGNPVRPSGRARIVAALKVFGTTPRDKP
jgi:DNA-binding LacI/PurR family transcriptional regulator